MPPPSDKKAKKSWFQRVFGGKDKDKNTPVTNQDTAPQDAPVQNLPPQSPEDLAREQYEREYQALSGEMDTLLARDKVSRSVRIAQEALAELRKRAQPLQARGDFQALLDKHLPPMRDALEALRDAVQVHDKEHKDFNTYYSAYHYQVKALLAYPQARAPQWLKDDQAEVKRLDDEVQACTKPKKDTAEEAYDYEEALKRAKALVKALTPALKRKQEHDEAMQAYYRELAGVKDRVSYAEGLQDGPAWTTELALVKTLKGQVVAAQNSFDFTEARKKLALLRDALQALLAKRLSTLQQDIDGADTADKVKTVVSSLDGEEISSLSAQAQAKLLSTLRKTAGGPINKNDAPDLYAARCKLYDNMKMQPEFREADEVNRNEIVNRLRNDPKVKEATKDWGKWDTKKRLNFLQYVAKEQCKVMGQPEPNLQPFNQPRSSTGRLTYGSCDLAMLSGAKTSNISINTHADAKFDNLEEQINTMLHENAHNYQLALVARYREDPKGLSKLKSNEKKLLPQIIMWDENARGYVPDGTTYNKQPLEAHAWGFGNEGASGILGPEDVATLLAEGELPAGTTPDMA